MTKRNLALVGALAAAGTAVGTACGSDGYSSGQNAGSGGQSSVPGGQSAGGQSAGGPSASGQSNTGGTTPSATGGSGTSGGSSQPQDCTATNVSACGGSVVGTWNVTSSCLEMSGDMDVFITSLACSTVPATGFLQTTGTFIANEDGTYTDNTTTTGSVTFPLDASCLAISGVEVECDRAGTIFSALGWTTTACSETGGQCNCSLSTEQQGGLGAVLAYTNQTGSYMTSGDTLTVDPATYSYCASGDMLTLTPQVMGLTGTVVLEREGTAGGGAGGMGGAGGAVAMSGAAGMGGAEPGGMGGAETGGMSGATMGGEGGATGGDTGSGGSAGATGGASGAGGGPPTGPRPCDIYEDAGTPCVAAHSTVRALFGAYEGNLYQVKRSDGMTQDIPVSSPGGFADSAAQDSFCTSECRIQMVYDQTGNGNFLEATTQQSTVATTMANGMSAAVATAEKVTVGGNPVYSLFMRPSQSYWNNGSDTGMPLGSESQGIYMVTSGEHFNGGCCYNYGNGQLGRTYTGGPVMDAIYFGNNQTWGTGAGNGPWVMADMEDGMLAGGTAGAQNPENISLPFTFVTAMEKNDGTANFALKGADATQPTLTTMYSGRNPRAPMRREGAVLLGAGGDCCYSNNNASEGTFYEGAIVSGYPSDATDEAIHANIVEAGYGQ